MSDTVIATRSFRVRARHEDEHHGRLVVAPSFEAAALDYVEHLPFGADLRSEVAILVRDIETGHEHSFLMHFDGVSPRE